MAKFDWEFSEDGDLVLGDPLVDDNGQVLYKQPDGAISIEQGENGKQIRDISWVYHLDAEKQVIMNRLRTDSPDWYHHPRMGGNLSDLIGEPNTRETAQRGVKYIMDALTYGGLYHYTQLTIRPIPISQSELLFMIDIAKIERNIVRLPIVFNLEHGLMNFYETPKPV